MTLLTFPPLDGSSPEHAEAKFMLLSQTTSLIGLTLKKASSGEHIQVQTHTHTRTHTHRFQQVGLLETRYCCGAVAH